MDSYHRTINVGVNSIPGSNPGDESGVVGSDLGGATLIPNLGGEGTAGEPIGFFAQAYDVSGVSGFSTGEKVISFRGTDSGFGLNTTDFYYGYGIGAGDTVLTSGNPGTGAEQGVMGLEFYQDLAGDTNGSLLQSSNITLTGHSLGGGLAGYVRSRSTS